MIFQEIKTRVEFSQSMQIFSPESICLIQNDKPFESLEMLRSGDTIEASLLFGHFPATPILPSHVLGLTERKNDSPDSPDTKNINNGTHPNPLERLNGLKKWRKGELDRQVECKTLLMHF